MLFSLRRSAALSNWAGPAPSLKFGQVNFVRQSKCIHQFPAC